ncbi:pentatricopeptide repeat-containing protein [Pyrus ussuriensis x Pyrus communis]|uniref:Pentatricopeptide repeat-containing protein n=1 Tax=Pyrus ussuriensis x Pyrus communis TaxID=2448454 RepID=A0A5N5G9V8_9ROSA|nr:pentatricopeptide repeat-containing protein [Pyrus ussuriensis x Pyrus communis]
MATKSESQSFCASFTTSESGNASPKPSRLQISEWMNQKGICIFSLVEHAVQLDLIGKDEFCTNCCEIKPV